jgi:hypothetical protein
MNFLEVKAELNKNSNKVANRTSWKIDKKIDKNSLESISETDKQSSDWVVREKIDE